MQSKLVILSILINFVNNFGQNHAVVLLVVLR